MFQRLIKRKVQHSKISLSQHFRRVRRHLVHKANVVLTTCPSAPTIQVVPSRHISRYSNKHRRLQLRFYELQKNVCHLSPMHCAYVDRPGAITSKNQVQSHKPIPYSLLVFDDRVEIRNARFLDLIRSQDYWFFIPFIHSLVFNLRGRAGRNQSPIMWPVWLWHTASWTRSWG